MRGGCGSGLIRVVSRSSLAGRAVSNQGIRRRAPDSACELRLARMPRVRHSVMSQSRRECRAWPVSKGWLQMWPDPFDAIAQIMNFLNGWNKMARLLFGRDKRGQTFVPNLEGMTSSSAEQALVNSDLPLKRVLGFRRSTNPSAVVVWQSPAPGTRVQVGTVVRVRLE